MSFFMEAQPWAEQAHKATGVLISVILAQWANETGYGGPDWSPRNNPGNVGDPAAGGQTTFPTLQAGVDAYISTMEHSYYDAVRSAKGWRAQCAALGASPWAASHYGSPPGSDLAAIILRGHLTAYDVPPEGEPVYILNVPNSAQYLQYDTGRIVELTQTASGGYSNQGIPVITVDQQFIDNCKVPIAAA